MIAMMLPTILLYEFSIWAVARIERQQAAKQAADLGADWTSVRAATIPSAQLPQVPLPSCRRRPASTQVSRTHALSEAVRGSRPPPG